MNRLLASAAIGILACGSPAAQNAIFDSYLSSAQKASAKGDWAAAENFLKLAEAEADGNRAKLAKLWGSQAAVAEPQFKYAATEAGRKKELAYAEETETRTKEGKLYIAHLQTLLANHYRLREMHDEAAALYKKALTTRERLNGPKAWETAQLLRDIADNKRDAGELGAAEPIYRRAIEIVAGIKGREYHLAFCLANLGELQLRQGKVDEAEALCRQALDLYEKVPGQFPLNLALCDATLGEALRKQKKVEEAAQMFATALKRIDPPPGTPARSLPILKSAAAFYRENGRTAEAKKLDDQIKEIEDKHKRAIAEASRDRQP